MALFWFKQNKIWSTNSFPHSHSFHQNMNTVIFLGIVFLVDIIWTKKSVGSTILGGILGYRLMSFNWFLLRELVNNTIVAKSVTYAKT